MPKILVPCDGSDNALRAVRHAASLAKLIQGTEIELLNVQDPVLLRDHVTRSALEIERMQADEAGRVLHPARRVLEAERIPYQVRRRSGTPASEIAQQVHESHCDAVVMGTRGLGPVASLMIGSVAMRVIHLVDVPVTLIK
ncbi:MAG TPA: universal stress protein [Noviherbaspirillum sp.]|uniref:universal stress protein n=1 Tax=Noviherbaspirillum sp. TaxID=1926288 RepID=UPI002D3B233F|nr:universal stress protein [Noviherbaspirillum sp.]HYD96254.1 universal stress protein [Noviherbaspirillum sp.]